MCMRSPLTFPAIVRFGTERLIRFRKFRSRRSAATLEKPRQWGTMRPVTSVRNCDSMEVWA